MELPTIPILLMTYETEGRETYARRTIESLKSHLSYEGDFSWIIADGNSSQGYKDDILDEITGNYWVTMSFNKPQQHIMLSVPGACGARWNKAVDLCYEISPLYFRLEDDMVLQHDLDITPYVRLLMEREDVGMVRLGLMPIHLDLHSVGYDGRIYMDVLKSQQYVYSGNPGLIHKRFHDAYGLYDENCNPGDTEVRLDHEVRNKQGPRIWMPWDLGKFSTPGPFAHIGQVQSYKE